MGMTDRQFDAYTKGQLHILERVQKELEQKGIKSDDLDRMIDDLKDQLKRP